MSEKAYKEIGIEWDRYGYHFNDNRTDANMIRAVEKLGDDANGVSAKLEVIEIPDGVDWDIDEYDGWEKVIERRREWS